MTTNPVAARLAARIRDEWSGCEGSLEGVIQNVLSQYLKPRTDGRCPDCLGLLPAHNTLHERYPEGGGGRNCPCPRASAATQLVREIADRCRSAASTIDDMAKTANGPDAWQHAQNQRLRGKAEGVRLALSYLDETIRTASAQDQRL